MAQLPESSFVSFCLASFCCSIRGGLGAVRAIYAITLQTYGAHACQVPAVAFQEVPCFQTLDSWWYIGCLTGTANSSFWPQPADSTCRTGGVRSDAFRASNGLQQRACHLAGETYHGRLSANCGTLLPTLCRPQTSNACLSKHHLSLLRE
jgi:hypothetical protein